MQEIHRNQLWLGHADEARSPKDLADQGIVAVVDLAYEVSPAQLPRHIVYCRFPLTDGAGNEGFVLNQALRGTKSILDGRIRCLIACSSGMSRAPAIAAHALGMHLKRDPLEMVERIGAVTTLGISETLWRDVEASYDQIVGSKV